MSSQRKNDGSSDKSLTQALALVSLASVTGLRKNKYLGAQIKQILQEYIEKFKLKLGVRQTYYICRAKALITPKEYERIQRLLVWLRKHGVIPYSWITDRTRRPIGASTWSDLDRFSETVRNAYRRNLWQAQNVYCEIWLEKDALSSFFRQITDPYQVRVMVGRGFSSISFLYETATELAQVKKPIYIYHFGDHDPSGHSIERKVKEGLEEHGLILAKFERVAILPEDIKKFNLPTAPANRNDTRYKAFMEENKGNDATVELDALPPEELKARIEHCIIEHINPAEWHNQQVIEAKEHESLNAILKGLGKFPQ
jgi:hypothetical protein